MTRKHLLAISALAAGSIVAPIAADHAGAKGTAAAGPLVKAGGTEVFRRNQFLEEKYRFSPGHLTVASGTTVTWKNTLKDEPHTITLSTKKGLPKSAEEADCGNVCIVAAGHLKDPKNPDAGIKAKVLNKGPAGLDEVGDSLALLPKKSMSARISAPAGTTLYYACAVHPWMQGEITVTAG